MQAYQWTAGLMGLSIGLAILWLVRRAHLHGPYAVWWIVVAVGVMLAGFFPKAVDVVGAALGVSYPPLLAVVVAIGVLLVKVLTIDLERTRQEVSLRRLTQRLAILEAELRRLEVEDRPRLGAEPAGEVSSNQAQAPQEACSA